MSDDSDERDDPFESFDAPDDVDPFEDLEGPDDAEETSDAGEPTVPPDDDQTPPGRMTDDPFSQISEPDDGAKGPVGSDAHSDADATDESGDGADATDDPFDSFSSAGTQGGSDDDPFGAFESVGVDEIDPDAVWDVLSAAEAEGMPEFDEKVFYEVSKHRFCERCEYFSEPPAASCSYEGAAIVEFLDMEQVRLVNCPVVAEQRALEESVGEIGSD
ncbi:hypothetical protein ACFR9U_01040 [Halorientalis brevis]|uniref:DUF8135 domain-containing protein n=1 Tax=Halorientalis brevis TaxID=1126241 RepID=A0ABD6C816_9EURY|nr:hypothetical protein [Halorientalis brevis]